MDKDPEGEEFVSKPQRKCLGKPKEGYIIAQFEELESTDSDDSHDEEPTTNNKDDK